MTAMLEVRKLLRQALPPLCWTLVALYFGSYLVNGERGLMAYARLSRDVQQTEAVLAEIAADRAALEHRVGLLAPDRIDPDMLDERSRRVLGLGRPDELVILGE